MGYLQKKKIRGHTSTYYIVTQRIEVKSTRVEQIYLGTRSDTGKMPVRRGAGSSGADISSRVRHA